ncbi:MAG: hypothetical protein FWC83_02640, partial [Alphaproteobacteria bacterium]|nr:hypothetical protein [Alphaproteobacteria bacterium]
MALLINKRKRIKKAPKKAPVRSVRIAPVAKKKMPIESARKKTAKRFSLCMPRISWTPNLPAFNKERFTLFMYWGIILFFVSSTFYIIGYTNSFMRQQGQVIETSIIDVSNMTPEARLELATEFLNSGRDKLLAGNITGAIIDLTVSIEAEPFNPEAFIYRGEAHMQVGDLDRARADFVASLDLDAGNAVAWYNHAIIWARQEVMDGAITSLNYALAANAERPSDILSNRDILSRRGQLNLWSHNFQAAVNDYTAAINQPGFPANPDDFAGRAEALTQLGAFS